MLSAFISTRTLIERGMYLDAGTMFRIMDEIGTDIHFLSGPIVFQQPLEKRHHEFLEEFFQEEFDRGTPLESSQKRKRVSREKIISYVARTYSPEKEVRQVSDTLHTVEKAFSGFVHGAAVHTLDLFDGSRFCIKLDQKDRPLEVLEDQFTQYIQRVIIAFSISAKALGDEDEFARLRTIDKSLFAPSGEYLPHSGD